MIRARSLAVTLRSWYMKSAMVASRRSERSTPYKFRAFSPERASAVSRNVLLGSVPCWPRRRYFALFLDDGDSLAEDGGSVRAFLTGRARADYDEIEGLRLYNSSTLCDVISCRCLVDRLCIQLADHGPGLIVSRC